MNRNKLNRRQFLGASLTAAGATMATAACVAPAAPVAAPAGEMSPASADPDFKFYFNTHGSVEISFWSAANNGFQDFCSHYNIDGQYLGTVRDGDFAEERENMERIVAAGDADAVVAVLSDVDALDEPIRQLDEQGVPVVLVNSKDPRPAEEQVPHLRYAGEDTYLTGVRNAQLALASFTDLAGRPPRRSTYIEHVPGAWVLVTRGQGMADVLEPEGTNFESIAGEVDPVQMQEIVRAHLIANPDVETIHTGWSRPAAWSIEVLREMGKLGNVDEPFEEGKVYVTSIDLDPELLGMIDAGDCVGTIDQQVYLQGWYGAALAWQWVTNQFLIANDISTGPYVVTQANAAALIGQAEAGIRA